MDGYLKDPAAVLDYKNDWSSWLSAVDDTLSESSWSAEEGITIDSDEHNDTETVVWLSGGTVGQGYVITNHIVTAAGREDDRSIKVKVVQR